MLAWNHISSRYGEDATQTGDLYSDISIVSQTEKNLTLYVKRKPTIPTTHCTKIITVTSANANLKNQSSIN